MAKQIILNYLAKHVTDEQYKDYVSFTVVRSPYSRLVSWWWSICKVDGDRYGHKKELAERGLSQSLEDFVVLWSEKKGTTQHVAIERHRYNHILKLENLERDLHALSFMPEHIIIPRANKKNYPHWRELMTPEAGQVINSIYKHEFDSQVN